MIKVSLVKSVNVRSGQVPLRFRLKDGADVDLGGEMPPPQAHTASSHPSGDGISLFDL